ncbi:MAG TPA: competence/damage-inducible protein A [Candidatus Obscuribacterales bacterium]
MPNAEILSIGTELLLGDVLDTNSQFLSQQLAHLGIDCFWRTTVGDNKGRIKEALKIALDRSDIVITTGGLGPTADDLTTECIAELLGAPLELDEDVLARIREYFRQRGITMPDSNTKQAMRPRGAELVPNRTGTAPGIFFAVGKESLEYADIASPENSRVIVTFPGVPSELKAMWKEIAGEKLRERFVPSAIWSCELKHVGIGESALAEMYEDLLSLPNPTVAPYAGTGECRLRVAAKAETLEQARQLAMPVVEKIKERSGIKCYGTDDDTLEVVVGRLLKERNMTLAVAESCTGGLVSKRLTDISGSSKYISLNVVAYSNDAKERALAVPGEIIEKYGAVSPQCAEAMAWGIRRAAGADIGLSVTGIAGPEGGTPEKPVGLVYLGLSAEGFYAGKQLNYFNQLERREIRFRTSSEALNMVRIFLLEPAWLAS